LLNCCVWSVNSIQNTVYAHDSKRPDSVVRSCDAVFASYVRGPRVERTASSVGRVTWMLLFRPSAFGTRRHRHRPSLTTTPCTGEGCIFYFHRHTPTGHFVRGVTVGVRGRSCRTRALVCVTRMSNNRKTLFNVFQQQQ